MSSEQLQKLFRIFAKQPPFSSGTIAEARDFLDAGGARFQTPPDVMLAPFAIDGISAELIAAPLAEVTAAVLYLHGGGYCIGSIQSHRYLMQNLSRAARARVLGIEYRLAPEHPFPAAVEDAVRAYIGAPAN